MIAALYSKDQAEKNQFIRDFAKDSEGPVIHVFPKNMRHKSVQLPGLVSVTYEDVTERDTWLRVNSLISPNATLIFENPSRYPKATTPKSRALRRLSMQVKRKALVDIVPFTLDVQYLYAPLSYLSRGILGYAHNYAFRENYQEMDEGGVIRSAHDFDVLANKMKSVCRITYNGFLCSSRQLVECPATPAEHNCYQERRMELFAKEKNPGRIITRLADTVHAFESRTTALMDLLSELHGRTVVYCNLTSYARRVEAAAKQAGFVIKGASYQVGAQDTFDNVIYFESPIVNSYYLLDAEAALCPDSRVYHFRGDTKVDLYLYGQIDHELNQIEGLTRELYRVSH